MSRWLAMLCVLGAVLLTSWATWGDRAPQPLPPGRHAIELLPGRYVDFAVGPELERVQLVSVVSVTGASDLDGLDRSYALDLSWRNPRGEVRHARRFWERSHRTSWPTRGRRRAAAELEGGGLLTDPRGTTVPTSRWLPGGGALRVSNPLGGPVVLLRGYGAGKVRDEVGDPGPLERARVARRVGVASYDSLDPQEHRLAMEKPWRSLAFGGEDDNVLRRVRTVVPAVQPSQRSTTGTRIRPGQATTVLLNGPVTVRISGPLGLAGLVLSTTVDGKASGGDLRRTPVAPVPLCGAAEAFEIHLAGPLQSLDLLNPTSADIGPLYISLADASPSHLAAWTPALPLRQLVPDASGRDVLVGPDVVRLPMWPIHERPVLVQVPLGAPIVQLRLRAVLDGLSDRHDRAVWLDELDAAGQVLGTRAVAVPVAPDPFARSDEDDGWLSQVVSLPHLTLPGAVTLRLRSSGATWVSASVKGPARAEVAPLVSDELVLRYRRDHAGRDRRLEPVDHPAPRHVLAMVRLQRRDRPLTTVERRYRVLEPIGRADTARTWLRPGAGIRDEAWCAYRAGSESAPLPWDATARRLRSGELFAMLHGGPATNLGARWRVELDGRVWRRGRLTQRVLSLRSVQEPAHTRARLVGPPGAALWVRARADGCAEPHRALRAWPLQQGRSLDFVLRDTWEGRVLSVSGFAEGPVEVDVRLSGLAGPSTLGAGVWTQRLRLEPEQTVALQLVDPDADSSALNAQGLAIHTSVPQIEVSIRQVSGPPMWMRAVVESLHGPVQPAVQVARVRGGR